MITWLNQNQGFVLGLLTFVYVAATLVLVFLTRANLKSVALSEKRRYRPHVVFDMYYEDITVYASLRNTGATPAFNVSLSLSPEVFCKVRGQQRVCPLIGSSLSFLAPTREVRDACAFGGEFSKHFPDPVFDGTLAYEDAEGTKYKETFKLDLRAQGQLMHIGKIDPGRELEKIAGALKDLTSSRFSPVIRIMTENQYRKEQDEMIADARRRIEEHNANAQPVGVDNAAAQHV